MPKPSKISGNSGHKLAKFKKQIPLPKGAKNVRTTPNGNSNDTHPKNTRRSNQQHQRGPLFTPATTVSCINQSTKPNNARIFVLQFSKTPCRRRTQTVAPPLCLVAPSVVFDVLSPPAQTQSHGSSSNSSNSSSSHISRTTTSCYRRRTRTVEYFGRHYTGEYCQYGLGTVRKTQSP